MTYTEDELYDQLINKYNENGYSGDLPVLTSKILSKYLYLHQA